MTITQGYMIFIKTWVLIMQALMIGIQGLKQKMQK